MGLSKKYNIYGTENKQALIFIHGAFVSSKMWDYQVQYFRKHFKVITYDLPGHGLNKNSLAEKFTFDLFTEDLKEILDALNLEEKPIICGLSLGGMILQHFAARHPHDYKAIILCDTSVTFTLTFWDKLMKFLFPQWLMILTLKMYRIETYVKQSFAIARLTRGEKWAGKQETVDYEKAEMLQMHKKDWIKIFEMLYSFKKQDLKKIDKPALIVLGEYEPKSIFRHADVMKREINNSRIEVIEDAGHVPNMDQPERFNKVCHDFMSRIS